MKRISPATVTFGVMAIVLGLVAAYIVRQSLEKPPVAAAPPPPEAPKPDLVPVVFASINIPKHTRISATEVHVVHVPKDVKAAQGTFRASPMAEGRITNQPIKAGQAIRDEYLMGIGEGLPDLAERIPTGLRAVTIQVQGADTGGKKLYEGDHIDLAMAVEGTHPDLGEVLTRTLLRNVLVVDSAAGKPLVLRVPRPAEAHTSITVAVEPADANKLIVAERTGTLVATLVSMQDVDAAAGAPAADDVITRRQLLGLKEIRQPKRFMLEKWSGGRVNIIEMSDDRIRESREVSSGQREAPTSAPAVPLDNKNAAIHSGVKVPEAALAVAADDNR